MTETAHLSIFSGFELNQATFCFRFRHTVGFLEVIGLLFASLGAKLAKLPNADTLNFRRLE